jgi:hypothetical protein
MGGKWNNWSADEEQYVQKNYKSKSYSEIAKDLGRTKDSVKGKARSLMCLLSADEVSKKRGLKTRDNYKKAREKGWSKKTNFITTVSRIKKSFSDLLKHYPDKVDFVYNIINKMSGRHEA